jgi:hypothetical protein
MKSRAVMIQDFPRQHMHLFAWPFFVATGRGDLPDAPTVASARGWQEAGNLFSACIALGTRVNHRNLEDALQRLQFCAVKVS